MWRGNYIMIIADDFSLVNITVTVLFHDGLCTLLCFKMLYSCSTNKICNFCVIFWRDFVQRFVFYILP